MGMLTWEKAVSDYEKKKSSENASGKKASGVLTWDQAVDEYDKYDKEAYKALGQQRIAQRQQSIRDRASVSDDGNGREAVRDWVGRYNDVVKGISDYTENRNGGYTLDASGGYGADLDKLIEDFDSVKQYTYHYGIANPHQYLKHLEEIRDSIAATNADMARFNNEKEYNKALKAAQDYEQQKVLDLDAAEKEIAELERKREDFYWNQDYDATSHRERVAFEQELKAQDELIDRKKQFLNQARHIQEGIRFSEASGNEDFGDYSGYVSTRDDGKWSKLTSKYGLGYQDLTYEYINDQNGIRDEIRQQHRIYDKGDAESEYEARGYDLLTEEEVGIYNYYYAKEGREKAQQYLDNLQETLNYRKATAMYGKMEDRTALELAFGVAAGVDQFATGTRNLFNTEDNYIEDSAFQMASQMVRQDLGDVGPKLPDWMGGATLGQVAYDTVTTSANMAPSILTSMAANMIAPGSGVVVGNAMMFASSAGGAYQEALKLGYGKGQARAYSTLVGGSEAGLQYLLGGIGALGGKVSGNALTKILNGVDNAFARTALKLGGSMLSEGMEEGIQEILTPWFKNLTAHANEEVDWGEVAYSSLLGALTAGFMEGGGTVSGEVNTWKTGRDLQNADVSAQRLAEIGRTLSADTVAYQLAGRVNENTDAYTMGRLFNEIDAEITEQNKADIQRSLERKGVSHRDAGILAESFAGVVAGAEFTEAQKAAIEANDVLARTVQEVIIDPNSTVNQRSSGYRDVLMQLAKEVSGADTARTEQAAPGQAEAAVDNKVEGEKEQPAQAKHEVSEDGKTIKKSTGEAIEIREVESIRDGRMTLKLQDGSTVDADDVIYSSEGEALVYEAVAKMNVNASAANVLVNAFQTESGVDAAVYARGIQEAYRYGQFNYPVQEVAGGPFSSMLTEHQRNTAYRLGKLFGGKQVAREEATVRKNRTDQKSLQVGKVHFDGDRSGLTDRQKASISALETVAEALGVQIHVFESGEANGRRIGANGWYDTKDGSIHIDLHAGATGEGTMLFTAAHELTHFIKQWSPAKFKVLANFLMEEYGRKGVSVEALVLKQMEKARKSGRTLTYAAAYEEVIADSMETMLSDGKIVEKLGKLKQQDKSLWQKIRDYVRDLAAKIRKVYDGLTPDSEEGQFVAEMKDSIERLQELFTEGLAEASANYQASLDPDQEGTVTDETGELVAHSRGDGTIQLSMRTYEESGREALRKYLQKCVTSKRLTKVEMQEMRDGIEEIYSICKEFKDKYAPFGSWSDAAVVRDTHGKPVFSVVTPNGDYKMNLDFSLVCRKRRTLDAVFNEMARRGIIDDFELGQKSVVKINEIIRSYGFETACALCFVDAKRFRQASMADSFVNLYNELVLSLVPEDQKGSIGHFNFSGYETIRKVEDGIDTWKNSRLDFSHIDHVLKTYGDGTVEYKAAQYIKAHPEGRKLLLRGDFMSSQGFDAVKTQNPEVLKLYNSKKGTGGPKAAFGDVQYMNEILKRYQWTPAKAYDVGGVRVQSFSDYVPRMVFDYVQMIYDLAVRKLPAHAYTKEALFAKQFGLTGIKINMSLIPAIAEGGIAPGLDANGDYVWAGESFDFETAKQIQNAEGYTENCGTICVGVSYRHILKLLSDPDIRMVIPYHKSGLNPIVAHMNKIGSFTDYTTLKTNPGGCQNTMDKNGNKVEVEFNFNEVLRKTADPKATVRQYLDWCAKKEYTPRFAEFAWHENYYKLIEDFTLYDKDGNYVPQREVRAVFPGKDSAFGQMKTLIEEGLQENAVIEGRREQNLNAIVDEIQKTLPRTEAEIPEEQVRQADRDLEAEVKYSDRPYSYESLTSKPDMVITIVEGNVPKNRADVVAKAKQNAAKLGKFDPKTGSVSVHVKDIDTDVVLATSGLKHSLDRRFDVNGAVVLKAGEILSNSIRINEMTAQKAEASESYVLIGAAKNDSGEMYVVRSVVNRFSNDLTSMDVLYAINAKKEPAALLPRLADKSAIRTDSTISISDLLDYVNQYFPDILPEDVLKHYGHDARPEGKLGESALYQDRSSDSVSNRSLLANAFESMAQTELEQKKIREYKDKIGQMNAEEENLRAINAQLRKETDPKVMRELRLAATQAANRINIYDSQLLRLEASRPLQNVLTREKKAAYDRGVQKGREALDAYRERAEKKQQEIIDRYQEAKERSSENRQKTAMRQKIRKVIRDLDKILNRGNKKRNVKEDMKDFVSDALRSAEALFTVSYSNEDMVRSGVTTDMTAEEARYMAEARALLEEIYNLPTGYEGWQARQEQESKLKAKLAYRMAKLKDVFARERARMNKTTVSAVLGQLADSYARLQNSEYSHVQGAYHENVHEYLKMLQEDIGETIIRDMSLGQLEELHKAYTMVLATVRNANNMFAANLNFTRDTLANMLVQEFEKRKVPAKEMGIIMKNLSDSVGWKYEKFYYALDRINSPTLKKLFGNLADSEDITMRDVQEAKAFQTEMVEKYHYNDWKIDQKIDHIFVDNTGKELQLTLGEMMALYAYSRREGADRHIEVGGFVFGKAALTNPKPADTYKLTAEQCAKITGMLTAEQRAFAESMQKFLSETMGAKGNEVSMKLYGIKMFNEENYFPLHIAGEYKEKTQESQAKAAEGFQTMSNAGFTHARKPDATAPIVLEDFMTVWADHVNEMSRYHGAVPALEDIRRVMNYSVYSDAQSGSVSVKAAMTNAYGKQAVAYFDNLYREANSGAVTDKMDAVSKKMLNLFRKNSVAYSASVVIQQPASIYRARMLVDRKYFGKHGFLTLTNGVLRILNQKKWNTAYAEMLKYAPGVTMAKEIGGFDTGTGSNIRSYLMDTEKSFVQSMKNDTLAKKSETVLGLVDDNWLANLPNMADKIAWIEMWEACKRETIAQNKQLSPSSEEFMQKVGKRFTEVIRATQVYDSMFCKSPMLKSKSLAAQYLVSFMNEPNTVANMAESILRNLGNRDIKQAAKTAMALIPSIVVTNVLKSIVHAMRDDDEDETFVEKYVSAIAGNLISDVTIFNYIPYIRDVWSIIQGYDVERADMAVVSDAVNAVRKLVDLYDQDTSDMTEQELSEWDKDVTDASWGVAETISALFGIPLKNLRREVLAVINTVNVRKLDKTRESTDLSIRHAVEEGIGQGKSKADRLYEALLADDIAYVDRLRAGYLSDYPMWDDLKANSETVEKGFKFQHKGFTYKVVADGYTFRAEDKESKLYDQENFVIVTNPATSALTELVKKRFMRRELTDQEATSQLFDAGVGINDAMWKVDKWRYELDAGTDEGYSKYRQWYDAIEAGEDLEPTIQKYLDGDVEEGTLREQIGEYFKPKYLKMTDEEKKALKPKLEAAYLATGVEQWDLESIFLEWDFEAKYGDSYDNMVQAFKDGEFSKEEMRKILLARGDEEEDADEKLTKWEIEARYGYSYDELDDAYREGLISEGDLRKSMLENGATEDEVEEAIKVYDWMKLHKGYSYSEAKSYIKPIEKLGITIEDTGINIDTYLSLNKKFNAVKNDVDENGKTITYSAVRKIMAMIAELPLTDQQKTALAYSRGWSDRTVRKYKLW